MSLQENLAQCNLKTGCSLSSTAPGIAPCIPLPLSPRGLAVLWTDDLARSQHSGAS